MKGKIKTTLLITVLLLTTISVLPMASAEVKNVYVDASKDDDSGDGLTLANAKKTIGAAITIAAAGDTIIVADGAYGEDLVIAVALTLKGENFDLDPTDATDFTARGVRGESVINSVTINDDDVTIYGFTVTGAGIADVIVGGHTDSSAAIFLDGRDDCVIMNNIITVTDSDAGGINLHGSDHYTPVRYSDDNIVTQNLLTAVHQHANYGIKVTGTGNTINDNELINWNNAAIHIMTEKDEDYSPDYNDISRNTITGTIDGWSKNGIWIKTGSHITIEDNVITGGCSAGIYIKDNDVGSPYPPTDITVSGNTITAVIATQTGTNSWFTTDGGVEYSVGIYVGTSFYWDEDPGPDTPPPVIGNSFTYNDISGCDLGMVFLGSADNEVHYNNLPDGLKNLKSPYINGAPVLPNADEVLEMLESLDAENNYWLSSTPTGLVDYTPVLTNPLQEANLDSEFYQTGATATVTVYDKSHNINTELRDIIAATAKSTTHTTPITISLRETGIDTSLFTGTFDLVDVTPGTGELLVNEQDEILVAHTPEDYDDAEVDDTSPVATLTAPDAEIFEEVDFVTGDTVELRVDVTGDTTWIASFRIDGLEIESVSGSGAYATTDWDTITYPDDTYTISVVVTDGAGNSDSDSIEVEVDNTGPIVTDPTASPSIIGLDVSTEMVLTATVMDDGIGIETVTVDCSDIGGASDVPMLDNGAGLDEEEDDDIYTSASITVTGDAEDVYELTITATDKLDNINDLDFITVEVIEDLVAPYDVGFTEAVPVCGGLVVRGLYMEDLLTGPGSYEILVDDVTFETITETLLVTEDYATFGASNEHVVFKRSIALDLTGTVDSVTITLIASDLVGTEADEIILYEGLIPDGVWWPVTLYEGWNLVSLPLIPDSSDSGDVMSLILDQGASGVVITYEYDQYTDAWITNPYEMTDGYGYWLYMLDDDVMIVEGIETLPAPAMPQTYEFTEGWVLAGYKQITATNEPPGKIEDYLASLADASYFGTIYVWDASAVTPAWDTLDTDSSDVLSPGMGFWIWMYSDQSLIAPLE